MTGLTNTALAQTRTPALVPNADLNSSIQAGPGPAFTPTETAKLDPAGNGQALFKDDAPPEGGWKGLARLLEAVTPAIDTSIPLTASQITDRISQMLDQGRNQEALEVIEKRSAQLAGQNTLGNDVQLLFLHGRALSALGHHADAIAIYQDMTTLYPELPEPWNNLAAEYVKQGRLELARDALDMALAANPAYATAQANLGEVQLMLARQSFQEAAQMGARGAEARALKAGSVLAQ
ncbi:tetratricopeptide repeat protein [Alcaligenaceae bacterium]|nr:tetratricopeptide repeat protein [Alcaligenaceae bacterium]